MDKQQKDVLLLSLYEEVLHLRQRVAELEAQLKRPKKTPRNSSKPPSQSQKPNQSSDRPSGGKQGKLKAHGKGGRTLTPNPDETISSRSTVCTQCGSPLDDALQVLHAVYEKTELPKVKPLVTRVEIHKARCSCCSHLNIAPAPQGMEPGSPFGPSIEAHAVYYRYEHAISYLRLARLFSDLHGLQISQGGLANLFRRTKPRFDDQVAIILDRLRRSRIVCSDETSARVRGNNHWEWVFQNDQVCLHVIRNSRAKAVVEEVMGDHRPAIWVSDLYGAQRGHADKWQICLAHQLRDCQYAIDAGDVIFAPRMKRLFLRACAVGRRRPTLTDATLKSYYYRLKRQLAENLKRLPEQKDGVRLHKRYQKDGDSLFTFLGDRDVPATNNGSERDIRPSATFRKVTGSIRSDWGKDLYAGVRSGLNTARRQDLNAFEAIKSILSGKSLIPLPG